MTPLDRVYADAERFMRRLKLRMPAEVEIENGVQPENGVLFTDSLGWRKLTIGWSFVWLRKYHNHTAFVLLTVPIAEAPESFRAKASEHFGELLDRIQDAQDNYVIDDEATRSIGEALDRMADDESA